MQKKPAMCRFFYCCKPEATSYKLQATSYKLQAHQCGPVLPALALALALVLVLVLA
jgi:hypothetical protein